MPAANDAVAVQACTSAVALANTAAVNFTCVAGGSSDGCLELISEGGAEITTLGGAPSTPPRTWTRLAHTSAAPDRYPVAFLLFQTLPPSAHLQEQP